MYERDIWISAFEKLQRKFESSKKSWNKMEVVFSGHYKL